LLLHYSKDFKLVPQQKSPENKTKLSLSQVRSSLNAKTLESETLKLLLFAFKKDQVLLRISNLEDAGFDPNPKSYNLDLKAYAQELFAEANQGKEYPKMTFEIEETALNGVTNYA